MKYTAFYILFRELTDINPFDGIGVLVKLLKIKLNSTACAANSREDSFKTLQAFIQIDGDTIINAKGANTADRMTYHFQNLFC